METYETSFPEENQTFPVQSTEPARTPAADPTPVKKPSHHVLKRVLACVLVVAVVAAGCVTTAVCVNTYWQRQNDLLDRQILQLNDKIDDLQEQIKDNSYTGNGNSVSGTPNVNGDGLTPGQLYAQCVGSVVAINCEIHSGNTVGGSSGSGFILSEDGYIVSNYHVVEGATLITVTTHDGEEYTAEIVGYDDTNDLSLLKAEATGLQPAALGSSTDLIIGDQVVAIGNPLGELTSTLTVGYVSAKERDITTDGTIINMLQTDAAINPGNSGGPLFNMKGEVVGITTAKYSGTTGSGATIEGIGFAIPIDDVAHKIQQLKENGFVAAPYMGVRVDDRNSGIGAYVISVDEGGSAEAAGIRKGDIIVEIGGVEVTCVADISKALRNYGVGDSASVVVYRSRRVVELTITFAQKPVAAPTVTPETDPQIPEDTSDIPSDDSFFDWWDFFFG